MNNELNFNESIHSGKSSLSDLRSLVDSQFIPLVDQADHCLNQLRLEMISLQSPTFNQHVKIQSILQQKINDILEQFILNQQDIKAVNVSWFNDGSTIGSWNSLMESFDTFLKTISMFNYQGTVKIEFHESTIIFHGQTGTTDFDSGFRKEIYAITRKLFSEKKLLTYGITEDEHLMIKLDYSHQDSKIYNISLEQQGLVIGFSNCFENYVADLDLINDLGKHIVIEIGEDLEVTKFDSIPQVLAQGMKDENIDKTVLHFPFIFRPISLIIPKSGEVRNLEFVLSQIVTGSVLPYDHDRKVDVDFKKKIFHYIDLFSIISD